MPLDIAAVQLRVPKEVLAGRTLRQSMDRIIDKCEQGHPHKAWRALRALPFEDLSGLRKWIEKPMTLEPPPRKLAGLWFGLFNPVHGKRTVTDIYVSGSLRFDLSPDDCEWACRPEWWPEHRYAHSKILAEIYRITNRRNGLGSDAEYALCLAYGALAVRDLLNEIDPRRLLDTFGPVGVAVGFDSGDFIHLGHCGERGLVPLSAKVRRENPSIIPLLRKMGSQNVVTVMKGILSAQSLGGKAKVAMHHLSLLAETHEDNEIRKAAIRALVCIDTIEPVVKETLFTTFKDAEADVRVEALKVVPAIRTLSKRDMARISKLENDPDPEVARNAKLALKRIESNVNTKR